MQLELNSKWIQIEYTEWNLNSTIGLRFNWIEFKFHQKEMRCKLVGKLLKIFPWIWCWIVINKKRKTHKESSLNNTFENTWNKFQFGIVQPTTTIYETSKYPTKTNSDESLSLGIIFKFVKVLKNNSSKVSKIITIELWLIWDLILGIQGRSAQHTHMV